MQNPNRLTEPGQIWQCKHLSSDENGLIARLQERLMEYEDADPSLSILRTGKHDHSLFAIVRDPEYADKLKSYILAAKDNRLIISPYYIGEEFVIGQEKYKLESISCFKSEVYYNATTKQEYPFADVSFDVEAICPYQMRHALFSKWKPLRPLSWSADEPWLPPYENIGTEKSLWLLQVQERLALYEQTGLTPEEFAKADDRDRYIGQIAQKSGMGKDYISLLYDAVNDERAFIIPYPVGTHLWVRGCEAVATKFVVDESGLTLKVEWVDLPEEPSTLLYAKSSAFGKTVAVTKPKFPDAMSEKELFERIYNSYTTQEKASSGSSELQKSLQELLDKPRWESENWTRYALMCLLDALREIEPEFFDICAAFGLSNEFFHEFPLGFNPLLDRPNDRVDIPSTPPFFWKRPRN